MRSRIIVWTSRCVGWAKRSLPTSAPDSTADRVGMVLRAFAHPTRRDTFREKHLTSFRELIRGDELIVAPCALNPIMARIAEDAGFKAVYMSGGSLGWLKCVTEANLALPELAEIAVDMRAVCKLPIILDAGGGWGDPMHVHRTIALTRGCGLCGDRDRGPAAAAPRRASHRDRPSRHHRARGRQGQGGGRGAHRPRPRDHRPHQCAPGPRSRRGAAARGSLPPRRRRHAVHPHPQRRGDADRRRAAARPADDLRPARRLCRVRDVEDGDGEARLSPRGVVGHVVRRHVQGGAPIHGMPRPGQARPLPRPAAAPRRK